MVEINSQPSQKKYKRTACTKKSTKVDFTPMVDLGFILITFFVFTAALSEPKAMNLLLPNDKDISVTDKICESCALTFILGSNSRLYYYEGKQENAIYTSTSYSSKGMRQLMLQKRKKVISNRAADDMVVIIKPTANSSFKNLINIVDECNISMVKRYYIDEITVAENEKLAKISQPIFIQ